MHKRIVAGIAAGAVLLGGTSAAILLPGLAAAADPSSSPAASSTTGNAGATAPAASTPAAGGVTGAAGNPEGPGGHDGGRDGLAADDLTAAASALGMTEADLTTTLQGGQTLAQIATTKNVAVQKVIDALVAAEKTENAAKVAAATITQAQADAQAADLTTRVTNQVNGVGEGPGGQDGGRDGLAADGLTAAASALGMTEADLTTTLQGGQTLAQIATTKNVAVQKVIDALVAAEKTENAAKVAAATITQAQADAQAADLTTRVTNQVNGVGEGPGGQDGGREHGGPGAPASNGTAAPSPSATS